MRPCDRFIHRQAGSLPGNDSVQLFFFPPRGQRDCTPPTRQLLNLCCRDGRGVSDGPVFGLQSLLRDQYWACDSGLTSLNFAEPVPCPICVLGRCAMYVVKYRYNIIFSNVNSQGGLAALQDLYQRSPGCVWGWIMHCCHVAGCVFRPLTAVCKPVAHVVTILVVIVI
jgi:hypothetical protein